MYSTCLKLLPISIYMWILWLSAVAIPHLVDFILHSPLDYVHVHIWNVTLSYMHIASDCHIVWLYLEVAMLVSYATAFYLVM